MEPNVECGFLIKRINGILRKQTDHLLQHQNLTLPQSHLLMVLSCMEGQTCSLKELEKYFHVAQSTIAGTVSRLERKGLLRAESDPKDRRVKRVRLTEEGQARCQESKSYMLESETRLTSRMTEEERLEFQRLLRIAYETVQQPPL